MYSWDDFGTCQCSDDYCKSQSETCCVEGDWNTYENRNSDFIANGLSALVGAVGGSEAVPSTAAVDAMFSARVVERNSAGALFEQLRDPHNLDFRPRPGSVWAEANIGAYDPVGDGGVYWIPGRQEWRPSQQLASGRAGGERLSASSPAEPGVILLLGCQLLDKFQSLPIHLQLNPPNQPYQSLPLCPPKISTHIPPLFRLGPVTGTSPLTFRCRTGCPVWYGTHAG